MCVGFGLGGLVALVLSFRSRARGRHGVKGLGYCAEGLGFRVQGSGIHVWGFGL